MQEWLKQNSWSLIIGVITLITTYASTAQSFTYRIEALERQENENKAAIQVLNTGQVSAQVQLAQIATDISYIKASLDRIGR